jgi:hypothetical protein
VRRKSVEFEGADDGKEGQDGVDQGEDEEDEVDWVIGHLWRPRPYFLHL